LLGSGDGTFDDQVTYAAGSAPSSVYAADLDGDGDLDLATANESSGSVSVLLGNGDGTFAAQTTYTVGDSPGPVFAADLDGDGDLDLATANSGSNNVSVLLGSGDGTFAAQATYTAGDPYSVYAADLDGDGDLDLATANYNSDNVSVLLGNGDGTFAEQTTYAAGDGTYSVFAADLDGDGDLDLATANVNSDNVSVLLNLRSVEIALSVEALNFGSANIDSTKNLQFIVYNNGVDSTLQVTDIASSNTAFTTSPTSLSVLPGNNDTVTVSFTPTALLSYTDSLTIYCNDPNDPQVKVYVSGTGVDLPPAVPTGLAGQVSDGMVPLSWNANSEADLSHYILYRSTVNDTATAAWLADIAAPGMDYTDMAVVNYTTYYYWLSAADTAGNESELSVGIDVTPEDQTPPARPVGLAATTGDGAVKLSWDSNSEGDLSHYAVYRNTIIDTASAAKLSDIYQPDTTYLDADVAIGSTYYYWVSAVDTASNASWLSAGASATSVDNTPPIQPTGLVAVPGEDVVALSWQTSSAGDIASYSVYRHIISDSTTATLLTVVTAPDTTHSDSSVSNGTTYWYWVSAVDSCANEGQLSVGVSAMPRDVTPPAMPTGLVATTGAGPVELSWDSNSEEDLSYYSVYRNTVIDQGSAAHIADVVKPDTMAIDAAVVLGTTYYYWVSAVDSSLNESSWSTGVSVVPEDLVAPAVPTGLVAAPGDRKVTLTWAPNTEGDLSHYIVYQSSTSGFDTTGASAASTADTTTIITNLSNGTTYYFVLAAVDSIGIQGTASAEVSAIPFGIVAVLPAQNALNVPQDTVISMTFDVDMNAATINDSTFVVHGSYTGKLSGTYAYDSPTRTATFDPVSDFAVGEIVTVSLTTGIETTTGNPLSDPYAWSFTLEVDGGSGTFAGAVNYGVGDYPRSLYAADLGSDGALDLVTANFYSNNVSVLLGRGDGTFTVQTTYAAGVRPSSVYATDLDGDGDLDLAIANLESDNISVLLGSGDGTFVAQTTYAADDGPISVVAADLDGDGDMDLAIANVNSDNVSVLLNNGDGTFGAKTGYAAGNSSEYVFSNDLDGDGDMDLMVANYYDNNVSVLLNNGDGTFTTQTTYAAGSRPRSVHATDLDGDGDLDLALANENSNNVSVLLGSGDGTFAVQTTYVAGNYPNSVYAADLDGDGDLDLATANRVSNNVSVLLGSGDGTFAGQTTYAAGDYPRSVYAADLDGDGDLDLATGRRILPFR